MTAVPAENNHCWFVLNHIENALKRGSAQKAIDRFNASNDSTLQLFAPTYVERIKKDGKYQFKNIKLAFHYVFVRGTFDDVKSLCSESNGFSLLINHGSENRYAIIRDEEMQHFKNIARAYENCLPYLPLDDIDLEDGDLVEVVNGDFPGLIGTFMPKEKTKSGNIVLRVFNKVGTIAYNINVSDVRVLEFSKNSKRANDQIDAFIPHLLSSLRYLFKEEALPKSLAAKLSVFSMRMSVVRLDNQKLDAKLQALLYAANFIIGNLTEASAHKARYNKLKSNISNVWTETLCSLIFSIVDKEHALFTQALSKVNELGPVSKFQKQLVEEFDYYLSNTDFVK